MWINFEPRGIKKSKINYIRFYSCFERNKTLLYKTQQLVNNSENDVFINQTKKYFKDKNDLVVKTLNHLNSADCKVIEQIVQNSENAIEESFAISKHVLDQFKDIHPNVWYDLERYHPKAMGFMDDHMKNVIYQWVCDNLKKGIEEGLYREDLKIPIIVSSDTSLHNLKEQGVKLTFSSLF